MAIAIVVTYFFYEFDINFQVDLTLLSIAIIFPLVFTIRGSFRRREKALEHLSEFRSSIKTVHYFFMCHDTLSDEDKLEIQQILLEINTTTLALLRTKNCSMAELDAAVNKVYLFALDKKISISRTLRDKVFRFMKDLHESIENVFAIHIHRTPISLKAYCEIFIYIFPLVYAPTIIFSMGTKSQAWTYFIVLITEYILISLYNIQNQLEYPFDNIGMDDINLEHFMINR